MSRGVGDGNKSTEGNTPEKLGGLGAAGAWVAAMVECGGGEGIHLVAVALGWADNFEDGLAGAFPPPPRLSQQPYSMHNPLLGAW